MAIPGEGTHAAAERREKALTFAVEVASRQQVGTYAATNIVAVAKVFEKYLADD